MVTESLAKRKVTSGVIQFRIGSDGLLEIVIPVAEAKVDEAQPLIEALVSTALTHYKNTNKLNPRDVVNSLRAVADGIERSQIRITEEKYNGNKRPRSN